MRRRLLPTLPRRLAPFVARYRHLLTVRVAALVMGVALALVSLGFLSIVWDLPDAAAIRQVGSMAQSTVLFDLDDRPTFTIYREQRLEVPLDRVSPHVIRALVAAEDQRFYEHGGIDLVRVAGAALNNLREGRRAQGASTITQQLARQSFLTLEKTIPRKLKEIVLAMRIERAFTKDEILQLYLNKVYFGDGLYGVEAASLGYFGRHAAELDAADAALLVGLVPSPSTYAPTVSEARALARRNLVLGQMRQAGAIDQETHDAALAKPLTLQDALGREEGFGLYFKEEVRRQVVQHFGWERVYQGGLRIYTTIDTAMQKAAEQEVARALREIEDRRTGGRPVAAGEEPLQAALVAMDPHTGEVRALVGGRDFAASSFNRATQARRQPGSAFKPFVYATALERGYSPASLITNLDDPIITQQGEWTPADGHASAPSMTMRAALRVSSNRAAVRMIDQVGIPETVEYASRLGVGVMPSVPSLALGSGEVTLLSITAAYGAFANSGMLPVPALIRRVEDADGTVLFESARPQERAISAATAYLMTTMMADVVDGGTAWAVRREGFTLPAAGKTGTTNDYYDAWFIGYTPRLVAGVWVGYDQPKTIVGGGYAAELAVPVWSRFMRVATRDHEPETFERPDTVTSATICRLSGRLAGAGCRDTVIVDPEGGVTRGSLAYIEHFLRGTEPIDYCPLHTPSIPLHLGVPTILASAVATVRDAIIGTPEVAEPAAAVEPDEAQAQVKQPERPRRSGFWGRIFRRR